MDRLAALFNEGRYDDAWRRMYELAPATNDYAQLSSLLRWRRRLAESAPRPQPVRSIKVALLGGATTDLLEEPLALGIEATGLGCEIFAAPYNTFAQEMLMSASSTVEFRPDVAVVLVTPANIPVWPAFHDDEERVRGAVDEVVDHFVGLCRTMHDHVGCEIVFSNFHRLPTRPLGTAGAKLAGEPSNFLAAVNRRLGERLPSYVHINDVESLAAQYGILNWFDQRFWYLAKQPVSFQCLPALARNTAQLIGALFGRSAKCVVVDLDNTLWGGVVGDDGAENVLIGEGDGVGEAFKAFQEYLLLLKDRGVLLAVCSKNEEENARAPFEVRDEMSLKLDDFAAFVANWSPKSQNLRAIAEQLNLGLEALVFVDDNPAEREEVRQSLPEVKVLELTEDPSDYPLQLDRCGWLDAVTLSDEDRRRSGLYRQNRERETLRDSAGDYESYLGSLEQRAVIAPFDEQHLPRITQLTNKTNQFNLTTRRVTASEVEAAMRSPDRMTFYVRLADRFGDNGLISVFIGRREETELWIDIWLMSCRVFGRGVEQLLCNRVVDEARVLGVEALRGVFVPTKKNGLVRDHYPSLGFKAVDDNAASGGIAAAGDTASGGAAAVGEQHWRLELTTYTPAETTIELVDDY